MQWSGRTFVVSPALSLQLEQGIEAVAAGKRLGVQLLGQDKQVGKLSTWIGESAHDVHIQLWGKHHCWDGARATFPALRGLKQLPEAATKYVLYLINSEDYLSMKRLASQERDHSHITILSKFFSTY